MKPKNLLLLWVMLAIAIIIMATNEFQLMPVKQIELADSVAASTLFVCPAADPEFDNIAREISLFKSPLSIIFMFFAMLWAAISTWTMYQALLKDKFEQKSFELPIFLGKFLLFAGIAVALLMYSPNRFRRVSVQGMSEQFVLCENNSPGAKPVRKGAVNAWGK